MSNDRLNVHRDTPAQADGRSRPFFAVDQTHLRVMDLHGSILENLERAVTSARRLRGRPVYSDTLSYWISLVDEGQKEQQHSASTKSASLGEAIARLQSELADRAAETDRPKPEEQ